MTDPEPSFTMAQLHHHVAVWWSRCAFLKDLQHQADLQVKATARKKFHD